MTYAYSLDGGETYHGSEPTPEDALGVAHDDLSTEYEAGTICVVHVARLVPGVEILRGKTLALEIITEHVCGRLEEALYDEVGGDEQLIDDLTTGQRQSLGRAILEIIAATGAIKGQGLADDTVHQLTLEN